MIRALIEGVSGYPGLFLFCAISGILFPVPEDLSLLYAGMRVAGGEWAWIPTLLVACLGVFLRDLAAFGIGRTVGEWMLERPLVVQIIGESSLDRARKLVEDHEAFSVLLGRFFLGMRAPIFFVAGAMGVKRRMFIWWDTVGLVIAVPGMVVLGYLVGEPMVEVMNVIFRRTREATLILVLLAMSWIAWSLLRPRTEE